MKKINLSIQFAIVAGVLNCIAWYALAKSIGFYEIKVYVYRNYLTLLLLFLGIFLSTFFTKRANFGFLDFKKGVKDGLLFSFVLAIIIAIFNFLYYNFITPDTIDFFLSEAEKFMLQYPDKYKAEDIPRYLEGERGNFSSLKLIPPILFFGLIISLLAAALFQKKSVTTDN